MIIILRRAHGKTVPVIDQPSVWLGIIGYILMEVSRLFDFFESKWMEPISWSRTKNCLIVFWIYAREEGCFLWGFRRNTNTLGSLSVVAMFRDLTIMMENCRNRDLRNGDDEERKLQREVIFGTSCKLVNNLEWQTPKFLKMFKTSRGAPVWLLW